MDLNSRVECKVEENLEHLNLQAKLKELNEYTELVKTLDITQFAPPDWLKHTENPFKWAQSLNPQLLLKANLDSKLDDYSNDNNSKYAFEKCSLLLIRVFEKVILKDNATSRIYLNQLEEELSNISCDGSSEMFSRIGPALKHIFSATDAYLMSLTNDLLEEETSKKIGASLEPVSQMSPLIQAGVEAFKGRFYLSCYTDENYALQHILAASKLDPDFPLWQHWTGKVLRKQRRTLKEKEPKDEIQYFENAVEKQRDPKYLVYLAQAYREKAQFLHKENSNDFDYFKSDISKQVDTLNQKSLELFNQTQDVQSQNLAGPTVQQIKERTFNCEIDLVVCSEKMDLIVTANSRGEVSLHRSLDLQTVWTKNPPNCKVKSVTKLTWRPDGQAIAIAYSYNDAESCKEGSVSEALVLVVSIENEYLSAINIDGDVSCLNWWESKITSTYSATTFPATWTDYIPKPTSLLSNFCVSIDHKKRKDLFLEKNDKMMNFLIIGSSVGVLKVMVGGFLSCCSISISSLLGIGNKKYRIRSTVFSSDMKHMFVCIEESEMYCGVWSEREAQILILDTSKFSLKTAEINLLKTRIDQILSLKCKISGIESSLTEVWECLKIAEIASNINKYGEYFESIESMSADFCELIMFGVLPSSLVRFLLQSLSCNGVKKIIQSVQENCLKVQTLVSGLKLCLEELSIILSELSGMAQLEKFDILGLKSSLLSIVSNAVKVLFFKVAEFHMVVQSSEKMYTAFYQWLYLVLTQLNSAETHNNFDFSGHTENVLPLIMDYLKSVSQISHSNNKRISLFQHLGQYLEDVYLSKPVEPNKWQTFFRDKNSLLSVAGLVPASRAMSLTQAFNRFYESISSVCSAPEPAITLLFTLKNVIDLPDTLLDCCIVENCYFTNSLTMVTAFVSNNNAGELTLVKVLPVKENHIKLQTVLKLGNENDYKCLDVKWYQNEKMYALFEERECSHLFLLQMEKSLIDIFNSDLVNINAKQDGVFVWKIPYLPVSCFALSCKRKFCSTVSKSSNKIKIFDMGFDENSIEIQGP